MTGENISLQAQARKIGKHHSRALRQDKRVPAVLYGPKVDNLEFSLEEKELVKYLKSKFENTIFSLESDDSRLNGIKVLRKETAIHPVSRRPVHVDFYAVDLDAEVRVMVEVIFDGKAEGVRNGGVLNVARREVEVECLPSNIPNTLIVDISNLGIDESLHVSNLQAPAGVVILTPETETLCTISTVEEVAEAPAAAADGEAAAADAATDAGAKEAPKKD